jgi:hypothetical protein
LLYPVELRAPLVLCSLSDSSVSWNRSAVGRGIIREARVTFETPRPVSRTR